MMRKRDEKSANDKAAKTINFEKVVLERLEEKAYKDNSTVSNIVNLICKRSVMNDELYYRELAREKQAEAFHYKLLAEKCKDIKEMI